MNQNSEIAVTAIILTHRHDELFLESLASIQFAKEVIILDNNSNNNWEKLRQKYHFTVVNYSKPINDFSKIRNNLIKKAKYEWVLFVDSDEVLENEAKTKILKIDRKSVV